VARLEIRDARPSEPPAQQQNEPLEKQLLAARVQQLNGRVAV